MHPFPSPLSATASNTHVCAFTVAHRDFTDLPELSLEADNIVLAGKATGQHVQEANAAISATRQRPAHL